MSDTMRTVQRERLTGERVRRLDVSEIVAEIHALEDHVEAAERQRDALVEALREIHTRSIDCVYEASSLLRAVNDMDEIASEALAAREES